MPDNESTSFVAKEISILQKVQEQSDFQYSVFTHTILYTVVRLKIMNPKKKLKMIQFQKKPEKEHPSLGLKLYQEADLNLILVLAFVSDSKKLTQYPCIQTRIFIGARHGMCLPRAGLAIGEDANIIALPCRYHILQARTQNSKITSQIHVISQNRTKQFCMKKKLSIFPRTSFKVKVPSSVEVANGFASSKTCI